jgi:hypothetical protein
MFVRIVKCLSALALPDHINSIMAVYSSNQVLSYRLQRFSFTIMTAAFSLFFAIFAAPILAKTRKQNHELNCEERKGEERFLCVTL